MIDNVTLKTVVMMLKMQFAITGINYILKYKIDILHLKILLLLFIFAVLANIHFNKAY